MLRLAVKGVFARKVRLALTTLCVVIGVGGVTGTFMFTDSINDAFTSLFTAVNKGVDVSIANKNYGESRGGDGPNAASTIDPNTFRMPDHVLADVRAVPGVKIASGTVAGTVQLLDASGDPIGGQGPPTFGFSWSKETELTPLRISRGRAPKAAGETAIDASSARRGKLQIGDDVNVVIDGGRRSEKLRIVGLVTFGDSDATQGVTYAVFDLATARDLFAAGKRYDAISAQAERGISQAELQRRIQRVLPKDVRAITGKKETAQQLNAIQQGVGFFQTAMLGIAAVTLFVGAFVIFNTFSIIVAQRTRELGLLRAIGATRQQVISSMVIESTIIGTISSVIGLAAGVAIAYGLRALLGLFGIEVPQGDLIVHTRTVVAALITGIGVTVLASIVPAVRAARITPIEALREGSGGRTSQHWLSIVISLVLILGGGVSLVLGLVSRSAPYESRLVGIFAGFALLIIGTAMFAPVLVRPVLAVIGAPFRRRVTGKLAVSNATRNPRRTASTAAAMMIGLGLASFIAIFTSSATSSIERQIDDTIGADLLLTNKSQGALLPANVTRIARGVNEITDVVPTRSSRFELRINSDGTAHIPTRAGSSQRKPRFGDKYLVAADPAIRPNAIRLTVVDGTDRIGEHDVLVTDKEIRALDAKLGDRIQMRAAKGTVRSFRIAGVFTSIGRAEYVITERAHDQLFPPSARFPDTIYLNVAPGATAGAARAALTRAFKEEPYVNVQSQSELKQNIRNQFAQVFGLLSCLLALALIIALIGIINTLALSVFERTREIGLLRAVGMTRWQTRTMITLESIMIALIGAVLGLMLGIGLGEATAYALREQGLQLALPVTFMVALVVVGIVAGIVAAVLPARRAARLDVLQAISTE